METIASESYQNSKLLSDIDNLRSRYLEVDFEKGISVIYPSCEIYSYEQNLFRLIADSRIVEFLPRWVMRPDYTSYDMYGTTIYWTLVLFVNNVYSIEDFRGFDTILVPPISLLTELVSSRVPKKEVVLLDKFIPVPGIFMFKRKPFDSTEKEKIQVVENFEGAVGAQLEEEEDQSVPVTPTILEAVEQFELSTTDINNKYIDLSHIPINYSSVSVYIGGFTIPQKYGYDYVLTYDDSDILKRISWNPEYCFNNRSTLNNLLKESTKVTVKFLYSES